METTIYTYLLVVNLITFAVYGIDKAKAKLDGWRIPEKTLLLLALVGGSLGAYAAMRIFRHKTKHPQFSIGIPVIFIIQVALASYLLAQ